MMGELITRDLTYVSTVITDYINKSIKFFKSQRPFTKLLVN